MTARTEQERYSLGDAGKAKVAGTAKEIHRASYAIQLGTTGLDWEAKLSLS